MGPENPLIKAIRKLKKEDSCFLVGGPVRDLLRNSPILDYDFLFEGDVFILARLLSDELNCTLAVNQKFLSASLRTDWGLVDINRARKEYYDYPGLLPRVAPASWQEDLNRRDFTINTMALPLLAAGWGEVVDYHGGREDLREGLIRFLHENSFRHDPTRMVRALRLKSRLNFSLEDITLRCLQRDWPYLNLVSPVRRLKEWVQICEKEPLALFLQELYNLGGWEAFWGKMPYCPLAIEDLPQLLAKAGESIARPWFLALLALLAIEPGHLDFLAVYWGLSKTDRRHLAETCALIGSQGELKKRESIGKRQVYRAAKYLPPECQYYLYYVLASQHGWSGTWPEFYGGFVRARFPIKGNDLLKLGLEQGPGLGQILNRLENAYWNEEFTTREEGLALARRLVKEEIKCSI